MAIGISNPFLHGSKSNLKGAWLEIIWQNPNIHDNLQPFVPQAPRWSRTLHSTQAPAH